MEGLDIIWLIVLKCQGVITSQQDEILKTTLKESPKWRDVYFEYERIMQTNKTDVEELLSKKNEDDLLEWLMLRFLNSDESQN